VAVRSRLLVLALFALVACAQPPTRTWDIPAGAKFARVNDYDMTYMDRGSGPPLVLVHGALTDYRFFSGSIDMLARRHRVISVGLRHYYPEAWDGRTATFGTQHASDIAGLIKALGLGTVHLFGHSRGAGVVLLVAKNSPEVLRTLIVAESGGGFRAFNPRAPLPGQSPDPVTPLVATTQALLDQGKRDEAAMTYWNGMAGPGAWDKQSEMDREFLKANIWTVRAPPTPAPPFECADIAKLPVPVLLMFGDKTFPWVKKPMEAIKTCVAHSQTVVLPNAGHLFPQEEPTEFAEALLKFTSGK
jgi:esterase